MLIGLGALVQFEKVTKEQPLVTRVGISFISEAQACSSAEEEVPTFDFDGTRAAAKRMWEDTLDKIYVDGPSYDDKVLFYSSVSDTNYAKCLKCVNSSFSQLYRHFISPVNKTGENPKWVSAEPYYDDFYCLW